MTTTEQIKAKLRAAFDARDREEFGKIAAWLLVRGYKPLLGPRGGLSFQWIGVARQEDWDETKAAFAGVEWKESQAWKS